MSGRLIVIEGLDGSGKSTQFELLYKRLSVGGRAIKKISFPDYGQPSSALVKMYLNGEFSSDPEAVNAYAASSFYAVDRYASYMRFWKSEYENGTDILAARYTTSNCIYQMTKLPKEQWDGYILWLEEFEYERLGLPRPDKVIFLDMPIEISQRLLSGRYGGDESKKDIHESDVGFLEKCRQAALFSAEKCGWDIINCSKDGEPLARDVINDELMRAAEIRV